MDIQERLTSFAMMGATWVMWVLIALSVVALAIAAERAVRLWRSADDLERLGAELRRLLADGRFAEARHRMGLSPSYEARILEAGLARTEDGAAAVEERMEGAAQLAKLAMERRLAFLGTVGNDAPFVGLLGTVIGIVRSFAELNASGGKVSAGLMAEVGEALVATAIGILVALPAIAFFNFFQRVIKARLTRAEALGHELLASLKAERS